ncbi:MAG: hypothetical protein U1F83_05885 [Verrucomicrobiota bacterium]
MPKDEFDFEDPFELNGMAFMTHEDTTDAMAETFIEEFMRMGYGHLQILALFRNPHYLGPNMAFEKYGEPFIRDLIADVFARWGKKVEWPVAAGILPAVEPGFQPGGTAVERIEALERSEAAASSSAIPSGKMPPSTAGRKPAATDPTGAPIPEYTV